APGRRGLGRSTRQADGARRGGNAARRGDWLRSLTAVTPAPATAQTQQEEPTQTSTPPAPERTQPAAVATERTAAPPVFHERPQPHPRDRPQPALPPERHPLLRAR